jgi:hypothetical protein
LCHAIRLVSPAVLCVSFSSCCGVIWANSETRS